MRAIALLTVLALSACEPTAVEAEPPGAFPQTEPAIAVVDGHIIPEAVVDAITAGLSEEEMEQFENSPQFAEFKDGLITQEILYRKALEAGAHESETADVLIALAAREAIVRAYMEQVGEESVTDEGIRQEYEDRAVEFAQEEVKAAHIMVQDQALAEEIMAQLEAGGDFAALAAQHSVDPGSKDKGGDLGWFGRARMLQPVAEAAFAAETGEIVGPVESRVGFHIIRVDDKRDKRPMEDVRDELAESVKSQALDQFVRDAKDAAEIMYPTAGGADGAGGADHDHADGADHGHEHPAEDGHEHPADDGHGH